MSALLSLPVGRDGKVTRDDRGDYYLESWLADDGETTISQVVYKQVKIHHAVRFGDAGRYCLRLRRSHTGYLFLVFDAAVLESDPEQVAKHGCVAKLIRVKKTLTEALSGLDDVPASTYRTPNATAGDGDVVHHLGELWQVVSRVPRGCANRGACTAALKHSPCGLALRKLFTIKTCEDFFIPLFDRKCVVLKEEICDICEIDLD